MRRIGDNEACATCGHRYAVHAGAPSSACIRYTKGERCGCRKFVELPKVARSAGISETGAET